MPDAFKFELVSPERLLFSGDVEQVLVPGAEGDLTIMAKHAPLIATLRPGLLEIDLADGKRQRFFARGGFAEVIPAGLTILAERAVDLDELDPEHLLQEITNAEEDVADLAGEAKDRAQMTLEHLRQVQSALQA
ncbi:MAG: F0F1 ATP synthase subunit epsilon [Pseudomonadota bacterium]